MDNNFYRNYHSLCLERGMTDNAVAAALGLSTGTVSYWKKGAIPRKPTLEKIAEYFGVSVGYLLTGEKDSPSTEADGRETELLRLWRSLTPERQERFFALLQDLAGQ